MKKTLLFSLWIVLCQLLLIPSMMAKNSNIALKRVEPLNWWVDMANPNLQLLVYGNNISTADVRINYQGVALKEIIKVENPNYLFVNLHIAPGTKPGSFDIEFVKDKKKVATYPYELKARESNSRLRQGFNASDAIYLVMPDRFANGNPANDDMPAMVEKCDRKAPYGRHGGDLAGIAAHLDFIGDLGMTAIWINPVQENNMPASSYHGYAITDYYLVDARFGTNNDFKQLVDQSHSKGIKIIMDMVFNHCGTRHWWMSDLPMADWINQWTDFTRSNYRLSTISDPYVSKRDYDLAARGWFDNTMADLNLRNPLMLNYLVQNSIWWIEFAGLDGIRQDTYPYPDKQGMAHWARRIAEEYPNFNIVGEAWIAQASKLCYWQKDFPNRDGFNSYLPSLMDFPIQDAIVKAFNEKAGWDSGLMRLYDVLADDHLYPNPLNMVTFGENHDVGRLLHLLKGNVQSLKMAMTFLATTRGIPQLYYGTELLMDGNGFDGHANIRLDMPGGWEGDQINGFTHQGRSSVQNDMVHHISKIFNYRKGSKVLQYGNLLHFVPQDDIYVYFRYLGSQAVMVIMNNNDEVKTVSGSDFDEFLQNYKSGIDVMTGESITALDVFSLPAKSSKVIELK